MKRIWAPWRIDYILGKKEKGCVLCKSPRRRQDVKNYVLHRGQKCFVILNKYPYNNGHLMVVPYRHVRDLEKMKGEELSEMISLVKRATQVMKKVFRPEGFNIGMNIGKMAGAGIDGHLHMHVVPRWGADTNFMPVLSETRCMPQHLNKTFQFLKKGWGKK